MIELSSRLKNFIFWVLVASISLIVFGVFVIDVFVTDAHGKDKLSIIFSYLSTVFTFLSALALFVTIGVYFWQKKDKYKEQIDLDSKIIPFVISKSESILETISTIREKIKEIDHDDRLYIAGDNLIKENQNEKIYCFLKCDIHDDFINKNKILVSRQLFIFIIALDSNYSRIISELSEFCYKWNYYYSSDEFKETGNNIDYKKLVDDFDNSLQLYKKNIIESRLSIINAY